MEPEARYTLIGAIVLALLGAAVAVLVWLSGAGSADAFRNYTVYFERQSLLGLQVGSDINMRGVKVGRVEDFSITRENINQVKVLLSVGKSKPVSENTVAVISRNLVTGLAWIDLETSGSPGRPLDKAPAGEPWPVIAEGRTDLDAITESGKSLLSSAEEALRNINVLLSPGNQAAVASILAGLGTNAERLDSRLAAFENAANSIQQAADAFRETSQGMGESLDRIGTGMAPLSRDARAVMADMRGALREISRAVQTIDRSTAALAGRATDVAEVGATELRATASEMRSAVDILSRTLGRLQDPRAALLGPGESQLGPGEAR